jgi:carbon monoxide dehydrogenase subunit G
MDMSGSQRIEASRETVWAALNNPDVLKTCIPGCEEIVLVSPTEMTAKAVLKIGPVKATFGGKVTLSELDPPNGYTITGEGQGGVAGFAKGGAKVRLEADGDATILHYDVKADVGGKIAQLGARLIDGTAKKLAGEFFETFSQTVAPKPVDENAPAEKKGWLGGLFKG